MLFKLDYYGIRLNVHNWLDSYLSNRTQCTKVNKTYSNYVTVTSGVLQGSVIGHLLFLIYINDLTDTINPHVLTSLFSDDAKLANSFKLHETTNIQEDINSLCKWMIDWELELALSKCVIMRIGCNEHPRLLIEWSTLTCCQVIQRSGYFSVIILVSIYTLFNMLKSIYTYE